MAEMRPQEDWLPGSAIFLLFDFYQVSSLPRTFLLDFCISCHITLRIVQDNLPLCLLLLSTLSTIGPIRVKPLQGAADSCYFKAFLKHKVIAFPQVPVFIIGFIQTRLLCSFKREYPRRKEINVQALTPRTASFTSFTMVSIEGETESRLHFIVHTLTTRLESQIYSGPSFFHTVDRRQR